MNVSTVLKGATTKVVNVFDTVLGNAPSPPAPKGPGSGQIHTPAQIDTAERDSTAGVAAVVAAEKKRAAAVVRATETGIMGFDALNISHQNHGTTQRALNTELGIHAVAPTTLLSALPRPLSTAADGPVLRGGGEGVMGRLGKLVYGDMGKTNVSSDAYSVAATVAARHVQQVTRCVSIYTHTCVCVCVPVYSTYIYR